MKHKDASLVLGLLTLTIIVLIIGPLLAIWALNVLFNLGIVVSIKTWFAAFILFGGLLTVRRHK